MLESFFSGSFLESCLSASFFSEDLELDLPLAAVLVPPSWLLFLLSSLSSTVSDFAAFSSLFWSAFLPDSEPEPDLLELDLLALEEGRLLGAPVDSVTVPVVPPEPLLEPAELEEPPELALPLRWSLPKKSHQTLSTLSGSFWYFSYISSTSHSLAPNPDIELSSVDSGTTSFASFNARLWMDTSTRLAPGVRDPQRRRPNGRRSGGERGCSRAPLAGFEPALPRQQSAVLVGLGGKRPWQDSNLRSRLRRAVLYPLSYRGSGCGREVTPTGTRF